MFLDLIQNVRTKQKPFPNHPKARHFPAFWGLSLDTTGGCLWKRYSGIPRRHIFGEAKNTVIFWENDPIVEETSLVWTHSPLP